MLKSTRLIPFCLGLIIIASISICKYYNRQKIFLLIIIMASIYYQIDTNSNNGKNYNFEDTLINVSKFIMISGISGYLIVRIVGLFVPGLD